MVHKSGSGLPREEIVRQVERKEESVKNYTSYVPIGNAPEKIKKWKDNGAIIVYLTSRRKPEEVEAIKNVLKRYNFPGGDLVCRENNETYANVAERIIPNVLVEDDCESIGGEVEMTYPYISDKLKKRIKSVAVKEFSGIDNLPDSF